MDKKMLLLLFILALSIRVASSYNNPVKWWDEAVYAGLGWNLKSNPFDYSFSKFGDYIPDTWTQAGFRAPLLSYLFAFVYSSAGENQFLINLIMPLLGSFGVVLLFLFAEKLFNEKIALYASAFLAFLPVHIYFSGRILTDVFVTTMMTSTFLLFWLGFEKNKPKFKILCAISAGLSILARYTAIWIPLVFLVYLILKNRNLKFLKDKYTILSIVAFFLVLSPWFWYGYVAYKTPLGPLLHSQRASSYWGGVQPWYFFFEYFPAMFSIATIFFIIGLFIMIKNLKLRGGSLLVILWFLSIFLFSSFLLPHKEDRFLLPLTPALCIIAGFGVERIKKYKNLIFVSAVLIAAASASAHMLYTAKISYTESASCFLKANDFIKTLEQDSVIFTDSSPLVYYYIHRETKFIPQDLKALKSLEKTYLLQTDYNKDKDFEKELNATIIFRCPEGGNLAAVLKL